MKLKAIKGSVTELETGTVVVNLFEGVDKPGGATGAIDRALGGQLSEMIADGEITGTLGETRIIHTGGRLPARRVLVSARCLIWTRCVGWWAQPPANSWRLGSPNGTRCCMGGGV